MKTLFLAIITAVALFQFVLVAHPVLAQDAKTQDAKTQDAKTQDAKTQDAKTQDTKTIVCKSVNQVDGSCGDDKILGPNGIFTKITQTLVFIIGAVSVLVIVIGGLRYVVSGGDPQSTKGAKDMILYAIVGIIVALLAQLIVTFVISRI